MVSDFLKKLRYFYFSFFIFSSHAVFIETNTASQSSPVQTKHKQRKLGKRLQVSAISENLKGHLLHIMSGLVDAHKYLKEKKEKLFHLQIVNILGRIARIELSQERRLTYHQRLYLYRQLQGFRENLRFITLKSVSHDKKMKSLKTAYKDWISISHIYALTQSSKQYGVYFCSKNSSVWVQNSNLQVYNPFNQNYRTCGQKIR